MRDMQSASSRARHTSSLRLLGALLLRRLLLLLLRGLLLLRLLLLHVGQLKQENSVHVVCA